MITAFHGEPSLKAAVMTRLRDHQRMDQIAQGFYYDDSNRGCHLGCITHAKTGTHETAERLFGIEQRIGFWLEAIFEGLPKADCAAWVIESTDAIPVGADMSRCHNHFGAWLLGDSGLLTITDGNRVAIETVQRLHVRAAAGEIVTDGEWSAARYAAWSAARSAAESAAEYAAESAAEYAAESAAGYAARYAAWYAARYAARSAAEYAARSAALSAAWKKMAAKSIEIFASAPVVGESGITPAVELDLCCRKLWCRDAVVSQ